MTVALHRVDKDELKSILREGLKRTSRGKLGDDDAIIATDKLLDATLPTQLKTCAVSRDNNIYAYLSTENRVIDITDGSKLKISDFLRHNDDAVLRLTVEPQRCYVSDLDAYDALKQAVEDGRDDVLTSKLAIQYWNHLIRLSDYRHGQIGRPELMITYDISPENITPVTPNTHQP